MKSFFLLSSLILTMTSAMASEREFRIDHSKNVSNGYAIAWGIPNQLTDFEKLDQSSEEEIRKFIDTANVANFLVDIETNSILAKVDSEEVDYTIGNYHIGNHFSLDVDSLSVDGTCSSCESVAVIESQKWSSGIKSLEIVDRTTGVKIIKSLNDFKVDNLIKEEIGKKIKGKKALALFREGAPTLTNIERKFITKIGEVNKISYNFSIPKSDEAGLDVDALVKLSVVNEELKVEVLSIKQKVQ
ncbi:MAG: hypothetical protein ACXVLQ_01525 [Bacteriovorax sp.]